MMPVERLVVISRTLQLTLHIAGLLMNLLQKN